MLSRVKSQDPNERTHYYDCALKVPQVRNFSLQNHSSNFTLIHYFFDNDASDHAKHQLPSLCGEVLSYLVHANTGYASSTKDGREDPVNLSE